MTLFLQCLELFYSFFKIGVMGFGGGYAMMSMIIAESEKYAITAAQFADLNALDMIVPGPIAINSATYVGYLYAGIPGAITATVGVSLPSLIIVTLVMRFIARYRENKIMEGFLSGVKPAAVGLIAAAALTIAAGVLVKEGAAWSGFFTNPLGTISVFLFAVFVITAVLNIKFNVNPILLTLIAGVIGAVVSLF
ncbi:MAG: chromate transporter [Eubacteriales bacterium]|jgi:chromate transporter|nr:chromate transporter [Clostridiales bacterium]